MTNQRLDLAEAEDSHDMQLASQKPKSLLGLIGGEIRASFHAHALSPPQIDTNFAELGTLSRIAEALRYALSKLEYSLSSGGGLRAWLKLNGLLGLLLAIPVILVLPVITLALGTFATWSDYFATASINIFHSVLAIAGTVAVVTVGVFVARFFR